MSTIGGPRLSTIPPTFFNDYSFEFDGTDDVVVINNTLDITNGLTMSCWVKFATTITSTNWLCSAGGTGGSNGHFNTRLAANGVWVNYLNGGPFFVLGLDSTALKDGNWHHIAQTIDYSNVEMRFYQDGVESTSIRAISTGTTTTKINQIGGASSTPVYPFTGNIDEFAILEGAKTLTEIQEIYNLGVPTDLTSLSPLAWYRMGDNSLYKDPQWLLPSNENKDKVSNYSMSFDGSNDYMSTSVSSLNSTTEFTISFWGKKTSTTKTVGLNDRVADTNKFLLYWWSNGTVYLGARNGSSNSSATFALSYDSDWHHFMGVYVGGTSLRLYVDGVLRDTITSSVPATLSSVMGNNITIGYVNDTSYTTGNIDEVSIWDSDQSANISTISSNPLNDLTSLNPIAYYKMGENATFKDPQWLIPNNENKDKISNYSMSFDGTDDYITISNNTSVGRTQNISYSVWVNLESLTNRQYIVGNWSSSNNGTGLALETIGGNALVFQIADGTNDSFFNSRVSNFSTLTSQNTWTHILGTWDGTDAKIYINGNLENTWSPSTPYTITNWSSFWIARRGDSGTLNLVNGLLDECSLFDTAISIGDVWDGSGKPKDVSGVSGITNYWKLGDDSTFSTNWTVPDQIGINDGTSANMDISDRVGYAPGSSGNTVSYNMDINDRVGDAPNSENNALSYNMVLSGRTTDVPT